MGSTETVVRLYDADKMERLHKALIPLVSEFDTLCRKNNIKYSLAYGSLIGAIRHKGFIPWDDDIDIAMDRKNYNKLLKVVRRSSRYKFGQVHWLRSFKRKNEWLSIDIFPYDNVPDNKLLSKLKLLTIKTLQGMLDKKDVSKFSFKWRILVRATGLMGKLFPTKTKQKWYDKVSAMGNKRKTKRISGYSGEFKGLHLKFRGDLFDEIIKVEFEGKMLSSVKDYDSFLRGYFGDYMTPPPVDQQVPKHHALNRMPD